MLLEFKAKNYKSFKEELVFSMIPAPKQKGLNYSILNQKIGPKKYKGLSSAVIYGPNASGKTNIIGAMEVFKSIILRGNIRNNDINNTPNSAVNLLELIPNSTTTMPSPLEFSIKFIENNFLIQYDLTIDIGSFLDVDYPRRILSEILTVNENLIFSRKEKLDVSSTMKDIKDYLVNEFEVNSNGAISLAKSNLNHEELFLTNGFKAMFSAKLVKLIMNWLDDKFMVIYRADTIHLIKKFSDPKKQTIYIDKIINEAAHLFGINSNGLGYAFSEDDSEPKLCSMIKGEKNTVMSAEMFESYGTIRFINMFPLVIKAIQDGGTLVVDEFDASLHPMALMSIINIFHNDEINKKNAQLIFNTHNPIFLNSNLFRRDEIKFVERDDETHCSKHYSLSDFGTTGDKGVRMHEDYMNKYFISQYGAIRDIDFTSIFESLLDDRKEV